MDSDRLSPVGCIWLRSASLPFPLPECRLKGAILNKGDDLRWNDWAEEQKKIKKGGSGLAGVRSRNSLGLVYLSPPQAVSYICARRVRSCESRWPSLTLSQRLSEPLWLPPQVLRQAITATMAPAFTRPACYIFTGRLWVIRHWSIAGEFSSRRRLLEKRGVYSCSGREESVVLYIYLAIFFPPTPFRRAVTQLMPLSSRSDFRGHHSCTLIDKLRKINMKWPPSK